MATSEQYDSWKTGMGENLESDAEQAAAIINAHIADSVDLTAMGVVAVADEDKVELYIGEMNCGAYDPPLIVRQWRNRLLCGFQNAITKKETT